jgi:hypothetical protein
MHLYVYIYNNRYDLKCYTCATHSIKCRIEYMYISICIYLLIHFYILTLIFTDITENAALVLHVQLNPESAGNVTFYVPVILMDIEDEEGD